jgi:hypothetical protein
LVAEEELHTARMLLLQEGPEFRVHATKRTRRVGAL